MCSFLLSPNFINNFVLPKSLYCLCGLSKCARICEKSQLVFIGIGCHCDTGKTVVKRIVEYGILNIVVKKIRQISSVNLFCLAYKQIVLYSVLFIILFK